MAQPYALTIRFRQQGDTALLDLETESGAGDAATMRPPFADDLPLVLWLLDLAQYPNPAPHLARLAPAERARLAELGLLAGAALAPDLHARVGRALLAALVADPPAAALLAMARAEARAAGRGLGLALRFPQSAARLADLPWELLWDAAAPEAGLPLLLTHGAYSSCVRYLTLPQPRHEPASPGSTLTILAVSPRAQISAALLARQRQALADALAPAVAAGSVRLITPEPPLTAGGLVDLVAHHRPQVLSFYGHGELREGQGHLLLDGPGGGEEWVAAGRLAPLGQAGVRLLLLHACHSDQPGSGLLSGTAALLSAVGVPAVVAMQSYIRITAATRLQAGLCRGIAQGQSVQEALAWARAALFAEERDAASWYVPTLTVASRGEEPLVLLAKAPEAADPGPAEVARAGARRGAARVAQGVVGTTALTFLAASSVLPLLTGGFGWEVIAPLLASLGGNTLAGWLQAWAEQNLKRSGWLDEADEERTLGALAGALERQATEDATLRDELAALLERTEAIPVALAALGEQVDAQTDLLLDLHDRLRAQDALLQALRADLRRGDLIQGRLYHLLINSLAAQTETLLRAYGAGTERLSAEVRAVLAEVQALRDELRAAAQKGKSQSGGVSFDGATIGTIETLVAGDSIGRDKIAGDKHEYHGPVTFNPPPPPHDPHAEERAAQLRAYLAGLTADCNQLTLSDIDDLDPDQRTVPLESVYIRLEVASTVKQQQRGKQQAESARLDLFGERERQQTALEALAAQRQLVLLGAPGSGKSTFVNHLAYCLARAALGEQRGLVDLGGAWTFGAIIPVRVVLSELAAWLAEQQRPPAAAQLLWRYLHDGQEKLLADHLQVQAQQGRAILLLDGLDEVPATALNQVRAAIAALRAAVPLVLVTCRVLDYADETINRRLAGWPDQQIIPLSEELQEQFITRWYDVLEAKRRPVSGGDYASLRAKLQGEVRSREELRRMAGNPLLLTMMAQLHAFRGELPAKRVLLYSECIDLLLRRWRPRVGRPDLRALLELPEWSNSETLRLLERLGYVTHQRATPGGADGRSPTETDLPRQLLTDTAAQLFKRYDPTKNLGRAEAFCNYIGQFSNGVIQQHGPLVFRFPHRTFQEYLAACRITDQVGWDESPESSERTLRDRMLAVAGQPQWREALLMAASQLVLDRRPYDAVAMVEALVEQYDERPADLAGQLVLAGELLAEIGRVQIHELGRRPKELWERVVAGLAALLTLDEGGTPRADVATRIRAGQALGQLDDPRPGVLSLEPDWCVVPAGEFLLGSKPGDEGASDGEQPQRVVELPAFRISRYPVTNAQWRLFVDAGGYAQPRWWGQASWKTKEAAGWSEPRWWRDPRFNGPNQPVVGISWHEAAAYCRWLSAQLGYAVRLPSEAEWEKAARGTDGRAYPWGNTWEDTRANAGPGSHSASTPVGCYPDGASPCEALDMSGNVLEWTATPWTGDYQTSDGTTSDAEGAAEGYVWRGGAWGNHLWFARCAYRFWGRPSFHDYDLGVRVVAALTLNDK